MFAIGWHDNGSVRLEGRLDAASAPQAREFLAEESLEQLARVVLNLNEFVYPE